MGLIQQLQQYHYPDAIATEDIKQALELVDLGYKVAVGDLSDPETYRRLRVETAASVLSIIDDMTNTDMAFIVREISGTVVIAANADLDDAVDFLQLASSTHVLQFMKFLGHAL